MHHTPIQCGSTVTPHFTVTVTDYSYFFPS